MTRTERSLSPRAIIKDRSESKSGMDKALRKGGAGGHNWGNITDEYLLETEALDDERQEPVDTKEESADKPELTRRTSSTSEEDLNAAREVRKRALKGGFDLASIARSSAAVSSPS
ncbi:hypothetical protein BJ322DRAFT_1047012 [Thelephora terrestris]|uniref:Hyaluronan/mRNA-binding protein domain-containing protein n=1 Tax=Thelephora terrestris TaxID=56493 RepID=A0A9P6HIZ6_9AGAM|nr:hypothetical protein BJ322DRAFT_1047012 [Thelephora terrestris]